MQEGRSKEIVHLVQIKTIQLEGREIKLTFSPVPGRAPLVNDALWKLRGELDIADFEFSRNHWSIRSAAALSKHLALPCAQCLRSRGAFFAPTALRLGDATMALRWVPTQLSGASRHRFALPGSAEGETFKIIDIHTKIYRITRCSRNRVQC